MFNLDIESFVRKCVTKRPESILKADFEKHADKMHVASVLADLGDIVYPRQTCRFLRKN